MSDSNEGKTKPSPATARVGKNFAGLDFAMPSVAKATAAPVVEEAARVRKFHSKNFITKRVALTDISLNPENQVYREMKRPEDMALLKRDIQEHGVKNPVILDRNLMLIEGEGRYLVCQILVSEGHKEFERIPAQIHDEELEPEDAKKQLILGNLSRFTVPTEQRVRLLYEIYPDLGEESGPTVKEVAEAAGVSTGRALQIRRIAREASVLASAAGRAAPTAEDFAKATELSNQRIHSKSAGDDSPGQGPARDPVKPPVKKITYTEQVRALLQLPITTQERAGFERAIQLVLTTVLKGK